MCFCTFVLPDDSRDDSTIVFGMHRGVLVCDWHGFDVSYGWMDGWMGREWGSGVWSVAAAACGRLEGHGRGTEVALWPVTEKMLCLWIEPVVTPRWVKSWQTYDLSILVTNRYDFFDLLQSPCRSLYICMYNARRPLPVRRQGIAEVCKAQFLSKRARMSKAVC